jgi:hypothetical protein
MVSWGGVLQRAGSSPGNVVHKRRGAVWRAGALAATSAGRGAGAGLARGHLDGLGRGRERADRVAPHMPSGFTMHL